MYEVETMPVREEELNCLSSYELKWVTRLRKDIHAHDFKPRVVVSLSRSPLAAVKVK